MSSQTPELTPLPQDETVSIPAETQPLSVRDVEAVINPSTDEAVPVRGLRVIEKMPEKVMQVQVEPSGLAHYALVALLRNGGRARVFPMHIPSVGPTVGIAPLSGTQHL
jgi:hypothetical protein